MGMGSSRILALKDEGGERILGPGTWLLWQRCCSAKAVSHCGWEEAPSPASEDDVGFWQLERMLSLCAASQMGAQGVFHRPLHTPALQKWGWGG